MCVALKLALTIRAQPVHPYAIDINRLKLAPYNYSQHNTVTNNKGLTQQPNSPIMDLHSHMLYCMSYAITWAYNSQWPYLAV